MSARSSELPDSSTMAVMLEYSRDSSQFDSYVPSQLSGLVATVSKSLICDYVRSSIPKTVEGPRVAGASGRVVVPELGQEESSAGAVEAAGGLLGARAAERGVVGAGLSISEDAGCKLHGRQGQHACGGNRLLVEGHCEGRFDGFDGLEQRLGV